MACQTVAVNNFVVHRTAHVLVLLGINRQIELIVLWKTVDSQLLISAHKVCDDHFIFQILDLYLEMKSAILSSTMIPGIILNFVNSATIVNWFSLMKQKSNIARQLSLDAKLHLINRTRCCCIYNVFVLFVKLTFVPKFRTWIHQTSWLSTLSSKISTV